MLRSRRLRTRQNTSLERDDSNTGENTQGRTGMKQLRRLIRTILAEENRKGLEHQILWEQLEDFVPRELEKLGAEISHFETDMMNNIKFAGEWYYDGVDRDTLESHRGVFEDFLNKRGWNVLKYSVETPFDPTSGRLIINVKMCFYLFV